MLKLAVSRSEKELAAVYAPLQSLPSGLTTSTGISLKQVNMDLHAGEQRRSAWNEIIDAAERYNQPGVFTTFIGWEWTAQPGGGNLHRVVFTPAGGDKASQFLPFSQLESEDPEDLWRWLGEVSTRTGAPFIADGGSLAGPMPG